MALAEELVQKKTEKRWVLGTGSGYGSGYGYNQGYNQGYTGYSQPYSQYGEQNSFQQNGKFEHFPRAKKNP